jgi:hypothetical protein
MLAVSSVKACSRAVAPIKASAKRMPCESANAPRESRAAGGYYQHGSVVALTYTDPSGFERCDGCVTPNDPNDMPEADRPPPSFGAARGGTGTGG